MLFAMCPSPRRCHLAAVASFFFFSPFFFFVRFTGILESTYCMYCSILYFYSRHYVRGMLHVYMLFFADCSVRGERAMIGRSSCFDPKGWTREGNLV